MDPKPGETDPRLSWPVVVGAVLLFVVVMTLAALGSIALSLL